MAIRAVIFDMDDTLLHTYKIAYGTFMLAGKQLGLKRVPIKKFLENWGLPSDEVVKGTWKNAPLDKFSETYGRIAKGRPYPLIKGANEMLALLKRKGLFIAILSTKHTSAIPLRAKQAGLRLSYFSELLGAESTRFHKPDARVFNKLIAGLKDKNIKKSEILYIGDSLIDYKAAKNAGLQFAAVLTGFKKKRDFLRKGLERRHILKSVLEVPSFIESQEIKAIVFDYGDVCSEKWFEPLMEAYSKVLNTPIKKMTSIWHKSFDIAYLLGRIKNPTAHRINKIIRMTKSDARQAKKLTELYFKVRAVNREILALVKRLRRHYKIAMLSNIPTPVKNYTIKLYNPKIFDELIFSCDVHLAKPDARIYKLLLHKLKLRPEQCIFIDDREKNIKAAEKLGIKTILYKSTKQLKEDLCRFDIRV